MRLDQRLAAVGSLGVFARLVELAERCPELEAGRLVGLPWGATHGEYRRPRLLGERCPLDSRGSKDERARRCVDALAVQLEPRVTALNEVELLLSVSNVGFVVLIDDPVACLVTGPGAHAEGRNPEVVANGSPGTTTVVDFFDLIETRGCVLTHGDPPLDRHHSPRS